MVFSATTIRLDSVCDGSSLHAGKSSQQVTRWVKNGRGQVGDFCLLRSILQVPFSFLTLSVGWQKGYLDHKNCYTTTTTLHPFNSPFPRTTWESRHQKGKPFWILLEQQIMGWQWHQLDHMQIICTSLQTDNHASTSPLSFYRLEALPAAKPKHWKTATIIGNTVLNFCLLFMPQ